MASNSLHDRTIIELLLLREDVDEIYGNGMFAKYIGKDISKLLGLEGNNTEKRGSLDGVPDMQKKSFVDVLLNDKTREDRTINEDAAYMPIKPPSNPKFVGGTWWWK